LQSQIMLLILSLLMPAFHAMVSPPFESLHAMESVPSRLQAPGSLASSRTLASSTVCSILEPYLPTDLGCSCAPAESGVGGTATCSLSTPEVEIIAVPYVGVPSITFEVGAEALPCGVPASAKVHGSVTLPNVNELPPDIEAVLNTIIADHANGLSIDGEKLVFSKEVKAGEEYTVDVPFYQVAFASFDFRMLLTVKGNLGGFTVEQAVDMCIKFGGGDVEGALEIVLCGANLPTCTDWDDNMAGKQAAASAAVASGSALATMCLASGFFNFHTAFKSPPYEVLKFTGTFTDICSAVPASDSGGSTQAEEEYEVEAVFTAEGEVGDFTDAKKTEIANVFATASGVAADVITVKVAAASVRISVTVPVTGESAATALSDTLDDGIMKNAIKLNEAFASTTIGGSAIASVETVKKAKKGAGDGGGMGGGAIAGLVIGLLAALAIIGAGVYVKMRSAASSDVKPVA